MSYTSLRTWQGIGIGVVGGALFIRLLIPFCLPVGIIVLWLLLVLLLLLLFFYFIIILLLFLLFYYYFILYFILFLFLFLFFLAIKDFITNCTLHQKLRGGVTKPTQGKVKQTSTPNRNNTKKQQNTNYKRRNCFCLSESRAATLKITNRPSCCSSILFPPKILTFFWNYTW